MMMKIFWFVGQSIILDYKFIRVSKWPFSRKIEFIFKKYIVLLKHLIKPFKLGKDSEQLFGETIFYGSRFGLADYQGILARHQKLISISKLKIKKKGIFIDVGANVGFVSKLLRDLYPDSLIYAVEPVPIIFDCLTKNFSGDKNIHFYNIAISQKTEKVIMEFNAEKGEISKISKTGNIQIEAKSFDDFIREQGIKKIDLLKIDTEGFEESVLSGAYKALSVTKYLFIEVTIKNNPNYTISSLMSHLYSKDFNFNLLAFRNFANTSEGEVPLLDCLMENIK